MPEQVVCNYQRKKRLEEIKQQHGLKSIDQLLGLFIELHDKEYSSGKSILIEELNKLRGRYEYLLSPLENELYQFFTPLLTSNSYSKKLEVAEAILRKVEGQKQLENQPDKGVNNNQEGGEDKEKLAKNS